MRRTASTSLTSTRMSLRNSLWRCQSSGTSSASTSAWMSSSRGPRLAYICWLTGNISSPTTSLPTALKNWTGCQAPLLPPQRRLSVIAKSKLEFDSMNGSASTYLHYAGDRACLPRLPLLLGLSKKPSRRQIRRYGRAGEECFQLLMLLPHDGHDELLL